MVPGELQFLNYSAVKEASNAVRERIELHPVAPLYVGDEELLAKRMPL